MRQFYSRKKNTNKQTATAAICWLWLLLFIVPAAYGHSAIGAAGPDHLAMPPLSEALTEDGTLRPGVSGAFDARNFRFQTTPEGRPMFRPAGVTGAGDYKWQDGFGLPEGINSGNVKAVAKSGTDVYIGGNFTAAGSAAADYVAKWNGTTWSSLGSGTSNGVNGFVRALAVAPNGDLYVGGEFTRAGGILTNGIAKWDGTTWSALGSGAEFGPVRALAIAPNGDVYAGGDFRRIGGVTANGLARWNGTTWSNVGTGLSGGPYVYALALDAMGNLYVGGSIGLINNVQSGGIAKWNGTSWSTLGAGFQASQSPGMVYALAVAPNGDVYAGGDFIMSGTLAVTRVAKWNGIAWSALGNGLYGTVMALAVATNGDLYAGGEYVMLPGPSITNTITRWNGTSWSNIGVVGSAPSQYNVIYAMTPMANGDIYVGGVLSLLAGTTVHGLGRWNGAAWSVVGTGLGNGVYGRVSAVAVASNGDVYIGGTFSQVGDVLAYNVAKWNGSAWSPLGMGASNGVAGLGVYALALAPNGDLYVGGNFGAAGSVAAQSVAKWNGTTWSALVTATGGNGVGYANSSGGAYVYALAVAPNGNVYVGGMLDRAGGAIASDIAMWDGNQWNTLGGGLSSSTGSAVYAIAIAPNGDVYAGGSFSMSGGPRYVAKWDGTGWNALGTSAPNNLVWALALAPTGELYAGGDFTAAGGVAANKIARWNGTSWSTLGTGSSNGVAVSPTGIYLGVRALVAGSNGDLYVGGDFVQAGGLAANCLARWNGSAWNNTSFGTGLHNSVSALALASGNRVVAGGLFAGVGDTSKPTVGFGIYDPSALPTATAATAAVQPPLHLYPNPAHAAMTVTVTPVAVLRAGQVLDVLGRVVRVFMVPAHAGSALVDVAGLAAGAYTVRVNESQAHLLVE